MTNDELKALYEKYPWAWTLEAKGYSSWCEVPALQILAEHRLKPKLPVDLPEPTEDMMNRAVYLGPGPIKIPNKDMHFQGFMCWARRMVWHENKLNGQFDNHAHYCIDINDPNADEIIALNRIEQTQNIIDVSGRLPVRLEQTMRELGWTPPGESECLQLDECEFQYKHGTTWIEEIDDDDFALHIIRNGPASVRVRRKK